MKVVVEGTPEEILTKGEEILKAVARRLGVDPLDLAHPDDVLQKAVSLKEVGPTLRYDVLKGLHEKERAIVRTTYRDMVKEIGQVLKG